MLVCMRVPGAGKPGEPRSMENQSGRTLLGTFVISHTLAAGHRVDRAT